MPENAQAVEDLMALATVVLEGRLCSGRLPRFVHGIQRETGYEPTHLVRDVARRIAGCTVGRPAAINAGTTAPVP